MNPSDLFGEQPTDGKRITHADKLAELERELRLRSSVYPKQIEGGRLDQERADRQVAVLTAIAEDYRIRPWPQTRQLAAEWRPKAEALTVLGVPVTKLHREEVLAALAFAVDALRQAGVLETKGPIGETKPAKGETT